jgi:alkanesulfonate monooxygenase SsuD/methylene tetrahydromethanopterin reductase-like flavin-dependent oxidoreductase (luciferase family)
VQRPHPPILIGGGGRRVLQLAARVADIVSFVPNMAAGRVGPESAASATGAATRAKLAWVREAAGDRFDALELHVNVTLVRLGDRSEGLAKVARAYATSEADAAEVPHALVGSVEEIAEDVLRRRDELGLSYLTVFEGSIDAFAPVIARLRA